MGNFGHNRGKGRELIFFSEVILWPNELDPDRYAFNANNYWCSELRCQRLAGDIINSKKNNARTNTNFSFSSLVLANNFFLQVLWKGTNRNDSRTSIVFIYLFFYILYILQSCTC